MLSILLAIARNTFIESVRQPIYFILIALAGLFQVFTTWTAAYSMGYSDTSEVSGDDQMMLSISMGTALIVGMLLSAFLATSVISKEIERKTVLTVVSKPVPRPAVVVGKYLGVAAAIVVAMVTILVFMLLGVRHGVMSTAADDIDKPVVLFSLAAVLLALGAGVFGNFFYGWVFSQTTTLLLCPLICVAYVLVLLVGKKWELQEITHNLKPQIMLACAGVIMAQLVMTAIATAASARLGQVMTIMVCIGALMAGLLSNYFLGRRAIQNTAIGRVEKANWVMPSRPALLNNSDEYDVTLELEPERPIRVGSPFYYGPNTSGFMLAIDAYAPFDGDVNDLGAVADRSRPPALVVKQSEKKKLRLLRVGGDGPLLSRPPQPGDFVFAQPTKVSTPFLVAWGLVPNMQFFWLSDAVVQNQPIPGRHMALLGGYTLCLIGAFLSLAVVLFQKREVG